jgi:UDPglucose 6-dehydrogenase
MAINPKAVMVIKSTVPVGYTAKLKHSQSGCDNILFSPEFLREGKALYDNLLPLAHHHRRAFGTRRNLCQPAEAGRHQAGHPAAVHRQPPKPKPSNCSPTLTWRCESPTSTNSTPTPPSHGLDTRQIIQGVSLDPRIGDHYNNPSFGYGGYCLPKDTKQLAGQLLRTCRRT